MNNVMDNTVKTIACEAIHISCLHEVSTIESLKRRVRFDLKITLFVIAREHI